MIADIFALFATPDPNARVPVEAPADCNDPQPREPVAHPLSRPRPAYARNIYPMVTTVVDERDEAEDEFADLDAYRRHPVEPKDPVAHPGARPHPLRTWAGHPRPSIIARDDE